jgi:drug/metabolite transporter (DMT)-like permease
MFNVHGLQFVSAGMERMILHVYPTLVIVFSALIFRKRLESRLILPLALCYAGIALSFGGEAASGHGSRPWLGGALVLMSAVAWALYLVIQVPLLQRVGPQRITAFGMIAASAAVVGHFLLTHPAASLMQAAPVQALAFLTAVFCTVLPAYLFGYGLQRVGTSPAAVVSCVGPVFTFFLAGALLGETVGPLQAVGLAAVLGGGLMLAFGKEKRAAPASAPAARPVGESAK